MSDRIVTALQARRACGPALEWAATLPEETTDQQAWDACPDGAWLLWWLRGADRPRLVLAACACARLALHLVPEGDERPRVAIETAERWARGEATIDDVRAARDAAYAASYAAALTADAASDAYVAAAAARAAAAAARAVAYAVASADAARVDAARADTAADAAADAASYAAADAARADAATDPDDDARSDMRRRTAVAVRAVFPEVPNV